MNRRSRRIYNRSQTAQCDICKSVTFLEQHHIRGRKIVNADADFNIANICANCHSNVHHGVVVIEDWIQSTDGRVLQWHKWNEDSLTGNDAKPWMI